MNLSAFIEKLNAEGRFNDLANNPLAQFGLRPANFLGAQLLPERLQVKNMYRETSIRYRTMIANSSSRYSPVQIKQGGQLVGSMLVELGESDIGIEITAQDYDNLIDFLAVGNDMQAAATVLGLTDAQANQSLAMLNEKQRWDAMLTASVVRKGDNDYEETVTYPNPTGHRVAAGGTWSSDTYDPLADIIAVKEKAEDKGLEIRRIITTSTDVAKLMRNEKVARRSASVTVVTATETYTDPLDRAAFDGKFRSMGLPAIETYDGRYYDQEGTAGRFLPSGNMVFVCATGRSETVEPQTGDSFTLEDTLGYTGIGRAAGQQSPGRVIRVEPFDNKPPRVEVQSWQTALPVIQDPEAVFVISGIA